MEGISPELREDFDRWKAQIGDDTYMGPKTVGILDVLRAHYLIIDFFSREYNEGVGGVGPKNLTMLHSTLSRQFTSYGKAVKWEDDVAICSTLFFGLVKNHAFHDVNKRTALLTLFYHLVKIKRYPNAPHSEYEKLALHVASNALGASYARYEDFANEEDAEVRFISDFLRRNTRRIDKAEYFVTYQELDGLLQANHFRLGDPDSNQIGVLKLVDEPVGFFGSRTKPVWKRIGSIAFPGWHRQVKLSVIGKVRRMTHLTVEYGHDSESFFHGADSLPFLLHEFQGLLQRLADK